jgi:hypothetical protein
VLLCSVRCPTSSHPPTSVTLSVAAVPSMPGGAGWEQGIKRFPHTLSLTEGKMGNRDCLLRCDYVYCNQKVVFWDVTTFILIRKLSNVQHELLSPASMLKVQAADSSETFVLWYQTT